MVYPFRDPELRQYVIECMIFRYTEKESMEYIFKKGYNITDRTFRNIKKDIIKSRFKFFAELLDTGVIDQHIRAIQSIYHVQREMWINYEKCEDPYKKVEILTQIVNTLPFLSNYYKATKNVLIFKNKMSVLPQKEDSVNLSTCL
jgi:hypothetical protein